MNHMGANNTNRIKNLILNLLLRKNSINVSTKYFFPRSGQMWYKNQCFSNDFYRFCDRQKKQTNLDVFHTEYKAYKSQSKKETKAR